jgi:hypothetical protein
MPGRVCFVWPKLRNKLHGHAKSGSSHESVQNIPTKVSPLWVLAAFPLIGGPMLFGFSALFSGIPQVVFASISYVYFFSSTIMFYRFFSRRPMAVHSPAVFANVNIEKYSAALRSEIAPELRNEIENVQRIVHNPNDQTAQFAMLYSRIDYIYQQHLILMHEQNVRIPIPKSGPGHQYEHEFGNTSSGRGIFPAFKFSEDLNGFGILEHATDNDSLGLTEFGRCFAQWIASERPRASYFKTPFGGWGALKDNSPLPAISAPSVEALSSDGNLLLPIDDTPSK